jgi:transcriptional regulator with XRE-family HTH domain
MARRGIPKGQVNWYLPEWMDACGIRGRGALTKMCELTGWSKATMSQLYNGKQDYSPAVVNAAAAALHAEPYELLMPPERAFAIRNALASIREIKALDSDGPQGDLMTPMRKVRT